MEEGSGGSRESQPTPRKEEKIAGRGGWSAPENAVKLKNVLAKINENGLRISPAVPASVPSTNPPTKTGGGLKSRFWGQVVTFIASSVQMKTLLINE